MQTDHFFKVVAIPNGPGCLIKTFYKIDAMNFVQVVPFNGDKSKEGRIQYIHNND